jgi:hypothetical protein
MFSQGLHSRDKKRRQDEDEDARLRVVCPSITIPRRRSTRQQRGALVKSSILVIGGRLTGAALARRRRHGSREAPTRILGFESYENSSLLTVAGLVGDYHPRLGAYHPHLAQKCNAGGAQPRKDH